MSAQSIDEGRFIEINGFDQWLVLRGKDMGNPAMLIVGGPGVALSLTAPFFEVWEKDFTLVHWDQPGAGATHSASPEALDSLSLSELVADGIEVADFVRQRLNVEKIAVLGVSGGSVVGLQMMHERPDYFSAYVGTGQFVNWAEQDALSYELIVEKAREAGNTEALQELSEIGPPPYADSSTDEIKSKYHSALTDMEMKEFVVFAGLMAEALTNPPVEANYISGGVVVENPRALAAAAYNALRPELLAFDARSLPLEYKMPVFFFQGDSDLYSVSSSVQAFESVITAPIKKTVVIAGGGHSVMWMRREFLKELSRNLLPVLVR